NPVIRAAREALQGIPREPDGSPQPGGTDAGAESPDVAVELVLAPDLPHVSGPAATVKRLVFFLLRNAAAVTPSAGPITVRTDRSAHGVLLRVEDTGPSLTPDGLAEMFDPSASQRPGGNRLELAACRTLARRLQGQINAEDRGGQGVAVIVELPAAS